MTIDAVIAEAVGMSNNEDVAYAYLYRQSLNYLTSERFALAEAIERSRELGQNPSYQRLAKRIRMLASMANA
ncbi:hypothetical protein [Azospirillum rugosum]|uniref:Uncharacterized protein n=1 Tax=Azospirillum rugosum TaxID=416170 RepID=A0ABS4SEX1_9PROT|nr:hypothetical protein [Azospirillum rugosum]MBP2291116.1 hypothetical protein [Azospirillum rugosum]MDQ0524820.1 hypothetical protein [Azospirillum rugosum]